MSEPLAPQATLKRLRRVVDAVGAGAKTPEQVADVTAFSACHVSYATVAARGLRFVEGAPDALRLTKTGQALHRTMPGSEDERLVLGGAVSTSPGLSAIAPGLLSKSAPNRAVIAKNMERVAGISRGTALHRAAMLLRWRKQLLDPQIRISTERRTGMWRRVDIRNFRSIEHAEVDLAPFTLVVGPNGSGKSNFADALVFARDVAFDAQAAISSRGGMAGVRRWRPTKPTDVTVDVRSASSSSGLDKTYARHCMKIHSGKSGNWNFSQEIIEVYDSGKRVAHVQRTGAGITGDFPDLPTPSQTASAMVLVRQIRQFRQTSPLRNVRRYRLNPEAMRQPQLSSGEERLDETGENIAAAIQSISRSRKIQGVVTPMTKIVPGLQDIYVEQVGRFLALKFKQQQAEGAIAEFNATEMSEGALRVLGIIVATHQMVRDELLIVEEPEVSIHVGAANLLFEMLKEASERGAVLITTHSADLLDAAKNEEILVCEYSEGRTRIGPLAEAQRKVVREGLFSVAELMRSEPLRIEENGAQDSHAK